MYNLIYDAGVAKYSEERKAKGSDLQLKISRDTFSAEL